MIEAVMFWNEPNNLSHWDFEIDRGWPVFARMVAKGLRSSMPICPSIVPELRPNPRTRRPLQNWSNVAAELASNGAGRT